MTCIIGMIDKENDCVWIGGDSLGSNGHTKSVEGQHKVFKSSVLNNVVMGSTSTFRHIDLLKYSENLFNPLDFYENTKIDHRFMVTQFIPYVIDLFQTGIINMQEDEKGANFIMGAGDKLFEIQNDYSVLEPSYGFCAVGSGESVAMGSLITTKDMDMTVPEKIIAALKAAEGYCCGVQRPFILLNTKDDKVIEVK